MVILLRVSPRIKVYEALGALGDNRVSLHKKGRVINGHVVSSDGSRVYRVLVEQKSDVVFYAYSNDNGTIYRRYIGYPILSVLMYYNILPFDWSLAKILKGIKWKELNEKFKNYKAVEEYVLGKLSDHTRHRILEYVDEVLKNIKKMRIYYDESMMMQKRLTDWLP